MSSSSQYFLPLKLTVYATTGYVLYLAWKVVEKSFRSNVKHIRGPLESASFLYGNLPGLLFSKNYGDLEFEWQKSFGRTYRIKGCLGEDRLFSSDPAVIKSVYNNKIFGKSAYHRNLVSMIFGDSSVFGVYHQDHARLRHVFNPAFSPGKIEKFVGLLQEIAKKTSAKLSEECPGSGPQLHDLYELIENSSMDAVAEVIMGYTVNIVETGGDEVSKVHSNIIAVASITTAGALLADSIASLLPSFVPRLAAKYIPTADFLAVKRYQQVMSDWSDNLIRQKTDNINSGIHDEDLLSIAVENNGRQEGTLRLTYAEIKDQIPSILVGGQDTTGNTIAFALYELAKRPEWQDKIREELAQRGKALKSTTDYDKLTLLNAHVKETLRYHPALPHTFRVALEDTVLQLSSPVTTTTGTEINVIPIRKGQVVYAGLASYNRNTDTWGEDAEVFDPLRWVDERSSRVATKVTAIGPYSNLASFLGGPHACLGWRFAVLETQIILADLVSKFKFEVDESATVRAAVSTTLQTVSEKGKACLPLRVTPL